MLKRNIFKICQLSIVLIFCVYMSFTAHAENSCNNSTTPSIPGNYQSACDSSSISWNDPGSADTIARNSSCTVAISDTSGKGGPYLWSVSGNGFSFTNTKTTGLSNTLYANGSACGSATIKITACGGNGKEVTGYVRCISDNAGKWVTIQNSGAGCPWSVAKAPDKTVGASQGQRFAYKTYGKWYVSVEYTGCSSIGGSYANVEDNCNAVVSNFSSKSPCCGSNCNECLTFTYYDARKPWPGVTARDYVYAGSAASCINGKCYNGHYVAYMTFWKTHITIREWRCP